MSEWLRLKNIPSSTQAPPSAGVLFDVVVSPYDVPEAVRGFKTPHGHFRIEFRYIDGPEPANRPVRLDDHVSVFEGRHTRRLLALEVNLQALGAKSVGVSISTATSHDQLKSQLRRALEQLVKQHPLPADRKALESTREALKSRESELLNQLVSA